MPPDKNLRLGQLWSFRLVDGPGGTWWFTWEVHDSAGHRLMKSDASFESLSECIADAKLKGYIEPEDR
jgi:hypothetical protein